MSTEVAIALGILAAVKELNLAYFNLIKHSNMSEEDKVELRAQFHSVALNLLPDPEDLK